MIRIRKPIFSIIECLFFIVLLLLVFVYCLDLLVFQKYNLIKKVPIAWLEDQTSSTYHYHKDYKFSEDWFSQHVPIWEKALKDYKNKQGIRYLEVGVFEGRAVFWMFENILTDPSSCATVVDIFEGQYNGMYPDFKTRYFENEKLANLKERLQTIPGYSQVELRKLEPNSYDIIYIDGSHENRDVLEDSILALKLLKKDGVLIFDDYSRENMKLNAPRIGIDTFYHYFMDDFHVLHNNHQVILKKK